jgi:cystathionine beta-lyase family protein involved in aluminum resistance
MTQTTQMNAEEIKDLLLDTNDGPVSEFTVIHRAVELIKTLTVDSEDIANAMYESLKLLADQPGHILPSTEFRRGY